MSATMRRLSGQDAIFVYAETPNMPMHTMGTTLLDPSGVEGRFGYEEIVETVASRVHLMPPFRQRLLEVPLGLGHPFLVEDPDFRAEHHLHRRQLPGPGTMQELAELVGELSATLLDRTKPLWEMWVVEGLETGEIALVSKMHHCMIDGASGSSQMAQLMDLEPRPAPRAPAPHFDPPPLPSALGLARRSVGSRLVSPLQLGRLAFRTGRGLLARRRAELEFPHASEADGGEVPGPFETAPETPWSGALTRNRAVAYGSAPLDDVKFVKDAFGVTVNDAVLAACTLAVRSYLGERGEYPERPFQCLVPVSLKSDQEKTEFSNKVSMLNVDLPTQLDDPAEVIEVVHRETARAKRVFEAVTDDLVAPWLELAPPVLSALGARLYSELGLADYAPPIANLVASNMMGPPVPLYFGGARVTAVYPMGPVGEGFGLNLTVLSNMGRLDLGVMACRERIPEPFAIADAFTQAVADLRLAAEKKLSA
ncbi:MAG: wax ester/triacylglycerol synthase family O-acyltransferase [Myxococcales bacterium]|nr:wax ester/triacylglycerol synthase family O-acyltransferase [Myxococcales bacterium]